MNLSATTIKVEPEKLELIKMKGVNVSQLCRDAIDSCLRLSGGNIDMLKDQLVDIEKQIQMLNLEKKLVLAQIEMFEANDAVEEHRNSKYNKWKGNLAFQINHKTIDWTTQKELFKFNNIEECKKWLLDKLQKDGLILES
jgi:hypothetical protein